MKSGVARFGCNKAFSVMLQMHAVNIAAHESSPVTALSLEIGFVFEDFTPAPSCRRSPTCEGYQQRCLPSLVS